MDNLERVFVFSALSGSHNYNLNDAASDLDYKIFTLPNFTDLYTKKSYCKSTESKHEDRVIRDIRDLPNLWINNFNLCYAEILYSQQLIFSRSLECIDEMAYIFQIRDEIFYANPMKLYYSCLGMSRGKYAKLTKRTATSKLMFAKYGYNTKEALHAYRSLDFVLRLERMPPQDAFYYKDNTDMLNIKHGMYSLEEYQSKYQDLLSKYLRLEQKFQGKPINTKIREELIVILKRFIKANLASL